ncbi:putative alpha-aminoadipic semialdehyde synthase, mitochondrial [Penaeus vannamei]|uniref:Putative alpha-aminoadipic semialdehyde synthase, mitochondrial n=1 Tax=Penaeus vannamei TaxID=6689 RepID=A0A423SRW0_PENVA|nr:putative alpha-aminoadipic semialdehyde synthase, mitochondrial [Penaeus vannamei]
MLGSSVAVGSASDRGAKLKELKRHMPHGPAGTRPVIRNVTCAQRRACCGTVPALALGLGTQRNVRGRVLAIRREDQSVWERRAPLGPSQVRQLVKDGVKVIVQPSNRRAYQCRLIKMRARKYRKTYPKRPLSLASNRCPLIS